MHSINSNNDWEKENRRREIDEVVHNAMVEDMRNPSGLSKMLSNLAAGVVLLALGGLFVTFIIWCIVKLVESM